MKNFLIIGASSGIGKEIAESLANSGYRVFGTYRNNQPAKLSDNPVYHPFDSSDDRQDLDYLPDSLAGLAYCPGSITLKPFNRIKPEEFINDYNLNVLGAVKIIQALLPRLSNSEVSSIVLFSTVAVQNGFSFHSLISASKGAVEGLTKSLAAEFAPKIRVNCIAPSLTETPLAEKLLNTPEKKIANANRHPLKRTGSPSDIARMAEFLLTDKSSWITGQVIHIDGGISTLRV